MSTDTFGIVPYSGSVDITTAKGYTELKLSDSQKMEIEYLISQFPSVGVAAALPKLYTVTFPSNVTGALMKLKRGGYTTTIVGEAGKSVGSAAIHPLAPQAVVMAAFTAMAVASGQHYLKRINNELNMMRLNLDKILEFLYGDKKAELMAEVSFVKYAYENYTSIMAHDSQRAGVITGLLSAKKIAMKDIEFYLGDLSSTITAKGEKDISAKAFQAVDCLELATQLYGMCSLLEVYYAQNFDADYLNYVDNDISIYLGKCESLLLSSLSTWKGKLEHAEESRFKKIDNHEIIERIDRITAPLSRGGESDLQKSLHESLYAATKQVEYYITKEGAVYLKTA